MNSIWILSTERSVYESDVEPHQPKENLFNYSFIHSIRIYKWCSLWCDCHSLLLFCFTIAIYFTGFCCLSRVCVYLCSPLRVQISGIQFDFKCYTAFLLCHTGVELIYNKWTVCDVSLSCTMCTVHRALFKRMNGTLANHFIPFRLQVSGFILFRVSQFVFKV